MTGSFQYNQGFKVIIAFSAKVSEKNRKSVFKELSHSRNVLMIITFFKSNFVMLRVHPGGEERL